MKAQYSAAEAQVRISEAATGVGEQMADVGLAMQRAADKTEQMRARADAVAELEAAGTFDDLTTLGTGQDDARPGGQLLGALGSGGPGLQGLPLVIGEDQLGFASAQWHGESPLRRLYPREAKGAILVKRISDSGH